METLKQTLPISSASGVAAPVAITEWLGRPINRADDPWYRFNRVIEAVNRCTAVPRGAAWLDVGCQMGQFLKIVQRNYDATLFGIDDFEPGNVVAVCRQFLGLEIKTPREIFDGSWHYFLRQIDRVGFALDNRFEFISALEVIEHMVDTDAFLDECHRHLVAGGWLVMTTPNINSLRNRVTVPLGQYPTGIEYRTIVHHVRLYNAATLKSHVESHGFHLAEMRGVSFLPRRWLRGSGIRKIDRGLSRLAPSLGGNLIAVFRKTPARRGC